MIRLFSFVLAEISKDSLTTKACPIFDLRHAFLFVTKRFQIIFSLPSIKFINLSSESASFDWSSGVSVPGLHGTYNPDDIRLEFRQCNT